MRPFNIRNIPIDPPLVLSPMAGVTDFTFRRLLKRRGGIGMTVSEFISVEGMTRNSPQSKRMMRFLEEERPFAVQIFGANVKRMAMAAEMAEDVGADILDVNCGCPAPKVVKKGGGSGLLRNLPLLEEILKEIKSAISIPLTLKIRSGFSNSDINCVDVAKLAEQCGVEHLALHGRTREQRYTGLADWDLVKEIKDAVSIPVSGNGDVTSVESALQRFEETSCDGILIGRGAMQNPWLFRQIQDALEGREPYEPTLQDKQEVLLEFFELLREDMPELPALGKMKQLAGQFTKGLRGGAKFRQTLYHSQSAEEILENIGIYFDTLGRGETFGDDKIESDSDLELDSCDALSSCGPSAADRVDGPAGKSVSRAEA
ncbi:MAG: tRNA dihydrouridine synthase DusB [Acidobacteria bacterium]|nr:MAG: tRNA dihydrouridine synthase DusB [Acidobacteriota bacterium]REK02632.1 MAG: tRNA dihydrouridine synthase DusB [Acidobacteriota bacterium]REK13564.1 MAG: tRNA dihydrouridine synthase DusB [Acidobacteriota bacterium]REK41558.1 MAG: tRNA dihydrouridine synthase DusB [Acidobacteriota bacterium]